MEINGDHQSTWIQVTVCWIGSNNPRLLGPYTKLCQGVMKRNGWNAFVCVSLCLDRKALEKTVSLPWLSTVSMGILFCFCKRETVLEKEEDFFICLTHNYTEYNQQWNVFSAFNPSKCTHTWSSGQPTLRRPGSSWGFGALLKGLTSVVDNSCWRRDSNPQPRVTSPAVYPLDPVTWFGSFLRR